MPVKSYEMNMRGTDWVVGDIHGCYSLLYNKLKHIKFNYEVDRLFCVGDLVDRGRESIDVLDILAKPWFHSVLGNHDLMAVEYYLYLINKALDTRYIDNYISNGGAWFINLDLATQKIVAKALNDLPIMIEIETMWGLVGIVHADCPIDNWDILKDKIINDADEELVLQCLWNRDRIRNNDETVIQNITKVYHGHTVRNYPSQLGNRYYIDTGAVFDKDLTIVRL